MRKELLILLVFSVILTSNAAFAQKGSDLTFLKKYGAITFTPEVLSRLSQESLGVLIQGGNVTDETTLNPDRPRCHLILLNAKFVGPVRPAETAISLLIPLNPSQSIQLTCSSSPRPGPITLEDIQSSIGRNLAQVHVESAPRPNPNQSVDDLFSRVKRAFAAAKMSFARVEDPTSEVSPEAISGRSTGAGTSGNSEVGSETDTTAPNPFLVGNPYAGRRAE